jgi:hypothetical protein
VKTIVVQNPSYPWPLNTSLREVGFTGQHRTNFTFYAVVCTVKHVSMWDYIRNGRRFLYSSTAALLFLLQNLYTKCMSACSSCRDVDTISVNTSAQPETLSPVEYNNQSENKRVTLALVCCTTLALKSIKVNNNRTVVYRTLCISNDLRNTTSMSGHHVIESSVCNSYVTIKGFGAKRARSEGLRKWLLPLDVEC